MTFTHHHAKHRRHAGLTAVLAVTSAFVLSFGPSSPASAQERQPITAVLPLRAPTVLQRADNLLDNGKVRESFDLLDGYLQSHPDDFGARWRAARAAVYMGILSDARPVQNHWYREGIAHARRALAARPDDLNALRWMVAAEGSLGQQTGARETVSLAKDVWRLAHHMLALDPRDAFADDALGTLDYRVMSLSSFKRSLARLFLGGGAALGQASWRDALAYHRSAVALDPGSILYRLDLANTLVKTGHVDEAVEQLRVAVALPEELPADGRFHARAEQRLQGLRRLETASSAGH